MNSRPNRARGGGGYQSHNEDISDLQNEDDDFAAPIPYYQSSDPSKPSHKAANLPPRAVQTKSNNKIGSTRTSGARGAGQDKQSTKAKQSSPLRDNLNLDQEGTSQMTYPNQFGSNFMSAEQTMQIERAMIAEQAATIQQQQQRSNYDGIYFDQNANANAQGYNFAPQQNGVPTTQAAMFAGSQGQPGLQAGYTSSYSNPNENNQNPMFQQNQQMGSNQQQMRHSHLDFENPSYFPQQPADLHQQRTQYALQQHQQQEELRMWLGGGVQNNQNNSPLHSLQQAKQNPNSSNGLINMQYYPGQNGQQNANNNKPGGAMLVNSQFQGTSNNLEQLTASSQMYQPNGPNGGPGGPPALSQNNYAPGSSQNNQQLGHQSALMDARSVGFDSFEADLGFQMPPDIGQIDADIYKISALTPDSFVQNSSTSGSRAIRGGLLPQGAASATNNSDFIMQRQVSQFSDLS